MDMARRLKAHRVLSPILCLLILASWGAFAYSAGSSASTTRDLRAELAQLKASLKNSRGLAGVAQAADPA